MPAEMLGVTPPSAREQGRCARGAAGLGCRVQGLGFRVQGLGIKHYTHTRETRAACVLSGLVCHMARTAPAGMASAVGHAQR